MQILGSIPAYKNQIYNIKQHKRKTQPESFNSNPFFMLPDYNYNVISFSASNQEISLCRKNISTFRNHCCNTFPEKQEEISAMSNFQFEEFFRKKLAPKILSAIEKFPEQNVYKKEYINVENITLFLQKEFGLNQEIQTHVQIAKELQLTKAKIENLSKEANKLLREHM